MEIAARRQNDEARKKSKDSTEDKLVFKLDDREHFCTAAQGQEGTSEFVESGGKIRRNCDGRNLFFYVVTGLHTASECTTQDTPLQQSDQKVSEITDQILFDEIADLYSEVIKG